MLFHSLLRIHVQAEEGPHWLQTKTPANHLVMSVYTRTMVELAVIESGARNLKYKADNVSDEALCGTLFGNKVNT